MRDHWSDYKDTGAEIVGISTDSVASHRGFADKYSLTVRLLSDPDGKVVSLYGVKSWVPGRSARAVIIIDKEGVVRYRKVQGLSVFRPKDEDIIKAIEAFA